MSPETTEEEGPRDASEEDLPDVSGLKLSQLPPQLSSEAKAKDAPLIKHGETITDRRSSFQPHLAAVESLKQRRVTGSEAGGVRPFIRSPDVDKIQSHDALERERERDTSKRSRLWPEMFVSGALSSLVLLLSNGVWETPQVCKAFLGVMELNANARVPDERGNNIVCC
ncbi:hypothetical protein DNTS_029636 [Danionella cerebrum]|uniref:Uncharacterized protein n=1 Tax=Danionella cerebrum TaxID=2873325 RepID=A0A553QQB1_9TELE|nr:hypothetical protein DNTS_029636 [Danionella translucida]